MIQRRFTFFAFCILYKQIMQIVREGVKTKVEQCLWIDKLRDDEENVQARFNKHNQTSTVAYSFVFKFTKFLMS